MKNRILLILLMVMSFAMLQAQSWQIYDASKLPSETGGDDLDLTKLSQDAPGANFVEVIMDDPDIPGNKLLRYVQSDDDATKMYRHDLKNSDGSTWTGDKLTLVARIKGLDNWQELGLDRTFDLQYRTSNSGFRDELRIFYEGDVELEKSSNTVASGLDFTQWHIFRIVYEGATSTIYIDENPEPFMTGTSTSSTSDLYIKIGDGSGDKIGGLVDWVALDVTGGYSPEQSPLDERFTGLGESGFNPNTTKILFLTKDVTPEGDLEEQPVIQDLRQRGFTVDVTYNDPNDITAPADVDFSFELANEYDLVIVGRGISSGDFEEAEAWAAVTTPVIYFSAYVMRSNRLKLVNSTTAKRDNDDASTVDQGRVINVGIADHPIFTGLDTDMDGQIGYTTWLYDYLGYGADTFEVNHNATLLATLIDEGAAGDGTVHAAYWDAGVEPYSGAGITLAGKRLYFQMGSDDNSSPKVRNYNAFTEESTLMFHNAIKFLLGADPDGELIDKSGPVAYWRMDEASDTVFYDAVGMAHGVLRNGNGVARESCGVNNSVNFFGATKPDAVIVVDDNSSIDFDGDQSFSISILAKIDPFSNTAEMNLLLKGDNRSDGTHLPDGLGKWYAVATKDGELRFALDDNITKTQLGVDIDDTMFPIDQWNHIVAVRDRAQDSLFLYLNGTRIGALLDETDEDIATTGLPLVIGNYHSGPRKVNGNLDEIAVYNYALGEEDVMALYSSTATTNECTQIDVISEASNDATLSELTVSVGTLEPAFDPNITSYKVVLPEGTTSVMISAAANHPSATVAGEGEFTNIPGSATLTVTAEDGTTKDYSISFSIEGASNARTVVEPGFETLWLAINAANDGDTLVLKNGEVYTPIEGYVINKKIVIIADTIPALPGLANMPIIENLFAINPVFQLNFGADLHLIGVDVDAQLAPHIFDVRGDVGVPSQISLFVNRCKLHNTTDDIMNDARDGGGDQTALKSCVVKNSFVYDSGAGHGFYIKNYDGENEPYIFENLTIWNLGQQFNWIRHYPAGATQKFVYNHITGYNLSSDTGSDKELFGNSDGDNEATLEIEVKNNIFHTQLSPNQEGSLKFNNTSGRHTISINNNVLFNVKPIVDLGGTINKANNQEGVDPQFVDPDNGDFTVMNTALHNAADDGEIVGALYWLPDFVDDFSDLVVTSAQEVVKAADFEMKAYPNPFDENTVIAFRLQEAGEVYVRVLDLRGQTLKYIDLGKLTIGYHTLTIPGADLQAGMYIYQLSSKGKTAAGKMIKNR